MRPRYIKYIYIAVVLLIIGNLLGSCVEFLKINDRTHFFLINPLSYLSSRKDIECYRKRNENNVNITRANFFSQQSIFFHSTSCEKIIDEHGACAIEAAAKLHPYSEINLLYTSPVSHSTWSKYLDQLVKLDNFRLIGIHVGSYADGTDLEEFWKRVVMRSKIAKQKEIREYIKFLTLHKFGGTVLDLDVIVNKPLDGLGDKWVVKDSDTLLATDALSISRSNIGRNITGNILRLLSQQIVKGDINGRLALFTVLTELCPKHDFFMKQVNKCFGFEVFEERLFHPINHGDSHYFYQAGNYDKVAYAHRLWDKAHPEMVIKYTTLYADIARTFCPSVFSIINNGFLGV